MSAVTVCPKCSRIVSLPAGEDRSVWVHCPLCHSQYLLQEALDYVPPALAIVPAPASDAATATGSSSLTSGMFHPGEAQANEHLETVATQHPELGRSGIELGGSDLGGSDLGGMAPIEHAEFSQGLAEHEIANQTGVGHGLADRGVADPAFSESFGSPHDAHEQAVADPDFADPEFAPHENELHGAEARCRSAWCRSAWCRSAWGRSAWDGTRNRDVRRCGSRARRACGRRARCSRPWRSGRRRLSFQR